MLPPDYEPGLLGNPSLPVTCPKCKHETREHYEHLKSGPRLVCPACEVAFTCDGEKLDKATRLIGENLRERISESLKIVARGE